VESVLAVLSPPDFVAEAKEATGQLYVVGGLDANFETSSIAWKLDQAQEAWEELPPMSTPRAGPIAVAMDGFLYVLGGENAAEALREVQRFDPSGGKWQDMAPMLQGRVRGTAVAAGGFVYVFGGQDGLTPVNTAERFDPASNTWTAIPSMHRSRYSSAATVMPDGKIVVFGGELTDQGGAAESTEIYDPKAEAWTLFPAVRETPVGSAVCICASGDSAFVVGGLGLNGQAQPFAEQRSLTDMLNPLSEQTAAAWTPIAPMPLRRQLASMAGVGSGVVVVGGKGPTFEAVANVELYEADDDAWKILPSLPQPRLRAAVVTM